MKLLLPSRYPSVFRRSSGLASDNAPPLHSNTAAGESCQLADRSSGSTTINPTIPRRPHQSIFILTFRSSLAFFDLFSDPLGTLSLLSWGWMLVAVAANQAPPSGRAPPAPGDWWSLLPCSIPGLPSLLPPASSQAGSSLFSAPLPTPLHCFYHLISKTNTTWIFGFVDEIKCTHQTRH